MFPSMEDCCLEAFGRRQACYWLNECNSVIEAVADNIVEEASGLVAFNGFGSAKSGKSGSNYCYSDCDCYDWQFCNFFSGSSSSTGSSSGKSGKGKSGKSEGYCQSCNSKTGKSGSFYNCPSSSRSAICKSQKSDKSNNYFDDYYYYYDDYFGAKRG